MQATIQSREFTPKKANGFWHQVGIPSRGLRLHNALHEGFPFKVYSNIAKATGLEKSEIAKAVFIPTATLQRRSKAGRFSQGESDRLYQLSEVFHAATALFEQDTVSAKNWLNNPVKGLGNKRPIEMIGTAAEVEAVLNLIGRLEHGVFA